MTQIAKLITAPICPSCGQPAQATETKFGTRHDCCGMHSWHGKPLETQATHDARKRAHAAFDPLWKHGPLSRKRAYQLLAQKLGLSGAECHISLMDEGTALLVPDAVMQIQEELA